MHERWGRVVRFAVSAGLIAVVCAAPASAALASAAPIFYLPYGHLTAVACPSATQCTAIGDGQELTFNPAAPALSTAVPIASRLAGRPACPSVSQCTVLDAATGAQVTFDPQSASPAAPATTSSVLSGPPGYDALACPAASVCVAVGGQGPGGAGGEVTFDPQSPAAQATYSLEGGFPLDDIACPIVTQCTAVDLVGRETTFDPANPASAQTATVSSSGLRDLRCPSTSACFALAHGSLVRFDPQDPSSASAAPLANGSVSCPFVSLCLGQATLAATASFVSLNPTDPSAVMGLGAVPFWQLTAFSDFACASVTMCVSVGDGQVATVDPTRRASVASSSLELADAATSGIQDGVGFISCPSPAQCTGTGVGEVTFNPVSPGQPQSQPLIEAARGLPDRGFDSGPVACPALTQCTTVGPGAEATFNPRAPGIGTTVSAMPAADAGAVLACPSVNQCTFLSASRAVTFDPRAPQRRFILTVGDPLNANEQLTCPSTRQCSLVTGDGTVVTFDPRGHRVLHRLSVDPEGWRHAGAVYGLRGQGGALSCASATQCSVVAAYQRTTCRSVAAFYTPRSPCFAAWMRARSAGAVFALTFNPRTSRVTGAAIASGSSVDLLGCPSAGLCVATAGGGELTFDPRAPHRTRFATLAPAFIDALSCANRSQCVAATSDGDEVVFTPR